MATHAQETCTSNWYQSSSSSTRNLHMVSLVQYYSGAGFLHAREHSSIPAQKLPDTWHELCNVIGWPVVWCKKQWWTCVKLITSFLSMCRHY